VVKTVTDETVVVENWWKQLEYDVLVIASGSTYHQPFKEANAVIATRASALTGCAKQLELSDSVLVIGGGSVGVELAAEITEKVRVHLAAVFHASDTLPVPREVGDDRTQRQAAAGPIAKEGEALRGRVL
jgi:NADH dehydrogenase FAD-containing subunit